MNRRLFNIFSAVSLALWVAVCAAWLATIIWPREWAYTSGLPVFRLSNGEFVRIGGEGGSIHVRFRNLVIPLLILPIAWLWNRLRPKPVTDGRLCPSCGYDLRASKDRCPECGSPIQTADRNGGNA